MIVSLAVIAALCLGAAGAAPLPEARRSAATKRFVSNYADIGRLLGQSLTLAKREEDLKKRAEKLREYERHLVARELQEVQAEQNYFAHALAELDGGIRLAQRELSEEAEFEQVWQQAKEKREAQEQRVKQWILAMKNKRTEGKKQKAKITEKKHDEKEHQVADKHNSKKSETAKERKHISKNNPHAHESKHVVSDNVNVRENKHISSKVKENKHVDNANVAASKIVQKKKVHSEVAAKTVVKDDPLDMKTYKSVLEEDIKEQKALREADNERKEEERRAEQNLYETPGYEQAIQESGKRSNALDTDPKERRQNELYEKRVHEEHEKLVERMRQKFLAKHHHHH